MLKSYSYVETKHQELHDAVIAFFDRIEEETGDFNDKFFAPDFLKIAKRHKKIVYGRLKLIYEITKTWQQEQRTELCQQIRDSNKIEDICASTVNPAMLDKNVKGVFKILRNLFLALYNQVLDGKTIHEEWGITLREHYDAFRTANDEIITCPICGISPVKMNCDKQRDQYDHYLPKSLYPYSAINFRNLVPTCTDCNSPQVKGDKDIIAIANGSNIFFPFSENHPNIKVNCELTSNAIAFENTEWELTYASDQVCDNQIRAWKEIYSIESRHRGFIKGRLKSWLKSYIKYCQSPRRSGQQPNTMRVNFLDVIETQSDECPLKYAALSSFLQDGILDKAIVEAANYSQ